MWHNQEKDMKKYKTLHHQVRCEAELTVYPGPRSRSVSPRIRTTTVPVDVTPVRARVRMIAETRRRSSRRVED